MKKLLYIALLFSVVVSANKKPDRDPFPPFSEKMAAEIGISAFESVLIGLLDLKHGTERPVEWNLDYELSMQKGEFFFATMYANGTGGGDGTNTGSPYTFQQAIDNASCGDNVVTQASDLGGTGRTLNYTCTSGTPITFVGVSSSWTAIADATMVHQQDGATIPRATYTGSNVDVTDGQVPFLDSGLSAGGVGSGSGITVSGSYVNIERFAVRGFMEGFRFTGSNHAAKDLSADYNGDRRNGQCCSGKNFMILATNSTFDQIYARDGSHVGIDIAAAGNDFRYVEQQTQIANSDNTTDYQFLMNRQCDVEYLTIIRRWNTDHLSHGAVSKPQTGTASGRTVRHVYLENCKLEVQGAGAEDGYYEDILIVNTESNGAATGVYYAATITVINGARNNTFKNIVSYRPTFGVYYENWNEGYSNDLNIAGSANTFINCVFIDPHSGHWGFNERNGNSNTTPTNENYYHCTFVDDVLTYNNGMTGAATGGIYNSIITSSGLGSGTARLSSAFVFDNINTSLNLAAYTESDISNDSFSFTDAFTIGDSFGDFDYSPTTNVLDDGQDRNSVTNVDTDINGDARPSSPTLGAFERNGSAPPQPSQLAFPSAEGYGKYAVGGRQGALYRVTNLNDSGAGSLRDAVSSPNRIVAFDVGGTITLTSDLTFAENITYMPETAPGRVEIQTANSVAVQANSIIRNLSVRNTATGGTVDAFRIWGIDEIQENIIIDRSTFYGGTDETVDFSGTGTGIVRDVTLQNSIIARNNGSGGLLLWDNNQDISFYENLSALNNDRHFYASTGLAENIEVLNNIVYAFNQNFNVTAGSQMDYVGNLFRAGDVAQQNGILAYFRLLTTTNPPVEALGDGLYHQSDNLLENNDAGWAIEDSTFDTHDDDNNRVVTGSLITPYSSALVESNVIPNVGAFSATSFGIDAVDTATINHFNNLDGTFGGVVTASPSSTTHPAGHDTDNDGMADDFEVAVGYTVGVNDAMTIEGDGYARIEKYGHYLNGEFQVTIDNATAQKKRANLKTFFDY